MQQFTVYTSNTCGDSKSCLYPQQVVVADQDTFEKAMEYDHVCARYTYNCRSNDNFEWTNVLPMDCDNDHSDNPADWIYPLDVALAFPNCQFAVSYSRNHMKAKNGKVARPKFHVYFPIPEMTDGTLYASLKKDIQQYFSYFDDGALGEARFLYGTNGPTVEFYPGDSNVANFMVSVSFDAYEKESSAISVGSRNSTMSRIAGKLIKRYGNTEECCQRFLEEADKWQPPLEVSF